MGMRSFKFTEEPEETTPEQDKAMMFIACVVGLSFIVLIIGIILMLLAYQKCNCNAV